MTIQRLIEDFSTLGHIFSDLTQGKDTSYCALADFETTLQRTYNENNWFTKENSLFAIGNLSKMLSANALEQWTRRYPAITHSHSPKNIGLIFAGNIPLVGFHDLLSVLITGHRVVAKLSSKDKVLTQWLRTLLIRINPAYEDLIVFTEAQLPAFDAVIATGSDSSAQYFEQYFAKYPHIIRRNRNSIAILTGNETDDELYGLADDIFSFFGLGCRNISKIYVPDNYDFNTLKPFFARYEHILHHHKYTNNFEYRRVIFLMNKIPHIDFGFVLLKEDSGLVSPPAVIYYEHYTDKKDLDFNIQLKKDQLQYLVSSEYHNFGTSQQPALWDYADNIDTLEFLLNL